MAAFLLLLLGGLSVAFFTSAAVKYRRAVDLEKRLKEWARVIDAEITAHFRAVMEGFDAGRANPDPAHRIVNPYAKGTDADVPPLIAGFNLGVSLGTVHFQHLEALSDSMLIHIENGFNGAEKTRPAFPGFLKFWNKAREVALKAKEDTRRGFNYSFQEGDGDKPFSVEFFDLGKELKAFRN